MKNTKIYITPIEVVSCCQNSTHTTPRPSLFQLPSSLVKDKRPDIQKKKKQKKKQRPIERIKKKQLSYL